MACARSPANGKGGTAPRLVPAKQAAQTALQHADVQRGALGTAFGPSYTGGVAARQRLRVFAAVAKKDRVVKKVLYSVTLERYVLAMLPNWELRNRQAGRTPAFRFCGRPGFRPALRFWTAGFAPDLLFW